MEKYHLEEIQKLLDDNHVGLVNCNSLEKMFWRYIPLSRLEEMLKKKKMAFIYPQKWADPFETLYLTTNFSSLGGYKQNKVYCLCGRGNGNEDAAWKVYSNGQEPLICVRFNIKKLLPQIRSFVGSNCNIYYSKICYDLSTTEIANIQNNQYHDEYLPNPFREKDYVRLMSLKRQSFKYEEEYRIFIVPQKGCSKGVQNGLLWVPIEYDIFERFTLQPIEWIREEDENTLQSKIKKAEYEARKRVIKTFIQECYQNEASIKNSSAKGETLKPKIYSSALYKDVKPIHKIT